MSEAIVQIEVQCLQPRWIEQERARYRLYVNDDLIVERIWIWDIDTIIEENLIVDVVPKIAHNIRLEHIKLNRGDLAQFGLRTLRINSALKSSGDGHRDMLSFTIE